jgi:hypothetical protein
MYDQARCFRFVIPLFSSNINIHATPLMKLRRRISGSVFNTVLLFMRTDGSCCNGESDEFMPEQMENALREL